MLELGSDTVRRHHDGSIDTAFYLVVGRQRRSKQTYHLISWAWRVLKSFCLVLCREPFSKNLSRSI